MALIARELLILCSCFTYCQYYGLTGDRVRRYMVDFLAMSTGNHHSLARISVVPIPLNRASMFEIRISGAFVGLLAKRALSDFPATLLDNLNGNPIDVLTVWNWKTGTEVLVSEAQHLLCLLSDPCFELGPECDLAPVVLRISLG